MTCVAEVPTTTTTDNAASNPAGESILLRACNRAITAVTVCHTGGCLNGGYPSSPNNSVGDLAKRADHEAQKVMSMLAEQMTVSKALIDDVEVLSLLVERLFS